VPPSALLATVALVSGDRPGGSPPLPPPISGLAKHDERRDAAAAEYQRQLASIDLDELDDAPTPVAPITLPSDPEAGQDQPARSAPSREPSATRRPNLEPIPDNAHPPQNRRIPTQPPIALTLDRDVPVESANPELARPAGLAPPKPYSRQSPSPVRRGLFSIDRITNLLAGAAVGLLLAVFPAKKLAESYETREVEPRLADLETSVAQTLAVDAGLVESPETVEAEIHDGRKRVRRRFVLIWLFVGVPIGLGLGFAPRPGD
jgi:hypothetical protein